MITTSVHTEEEKNQLCLHALKCPNSFAVKNQLKKSKGNLLPQSIDWIHQDQKYKSWQDGDEVGLLWIKGGAGKGKTMISIGIIEKLSRPKDGLEHSTVVTYFFCKYGDSELNTLEAIVKGLILQLVTQQPVLKESLRDRWDESGRFKEDVTSWQILWGILLEMLDRYHNGMTEFLRHIVLNGLSLSGKMKWLLTSRPFVSAEQELFTSHDQSHISLDLNSTQVSDAVNEYIISKLDELSCRHKYGSVLKSQLEAELVAKAQGTFLWVSLVCKELGKLENPHSSEVLSTLQNLPAGLHPFYDRMFNRLETGDPTDVFKCIRLLRVMMLAYRPLKVEEIPGLIGVTEQNHHNLSSIISVIDRCASFIHIQENSVQFVHQSARDYLAGKDLDDDFGHSELARMCLHHLSKSLHQNLLGLQRPDSTRDSWKELADRGQNTVLASLDYAATFWAHHLDNPEPTKEIGEVDTFLRTKFLEWLECLSWLDKLSLAFEAFQILTRVEKDFHLTPTLLQDARSFLLRHYPTMNHWPLQIYSSAIIFSPKSSFIKVQNLDQSPRWIGKTSPMEDTWASLVRTLAGHSGRVYTLAFSPDGNTIASGSSDRTIKIWDATAGNCQETLHGHLREVSTLVFSPDGKMLASGSSDKTIKLWNATTWDCQRTFYGHSGKGFALAFSPDGNKIASGSINSTLNIWDTTTGDCQKTLEGHFNADEALVFTPDRNVIFYTFPDDAFELWNATVHYEVKFCRHFGAVRSIAFSLDGKVMASGSSDEIKLWDVTSGDCRRTLYGHSRGVSALAFSPDGDVIASGFFDGHIKLWDVTTGDFLREYHGHSSRICTIAFSPDGNTIASGSPDQTIKFWDATTRNCRETQRDHSRPVNTPLLSPMESTIAPDSYKPANLWRSMRGHSQGTPISQVMRVTAMAVSPDARWIALGGLLKMLVWDTITGDLSREMSKIPIYPLFPVTAVCFSPDGKQIVSGSNAGNLVLWHNRKNDSYEILDDGQTHGGSIISAVAFSPDGKQIASSSGSTVHIRDATTGRFQERLNGHSGSVISSIAFSSDGKQIACGSNNIIRIWDMSKPLKSSNFLGPTIQSFLMPRPSLDIKTSEKIQNLKFSTDGRYLTTNIGPINIGNRANGLQIIGYAMEKCVFFEYRQNFGRDFMTHKAINWLLRSKMVECRVFSLTEGPWCPW
ncbi:G-protein beta WD- 40 repeats containing protein [Penicillium herquei]|nr:G-protein beta WD- 40 repeats containing protein [Penicillium herquei]